MQQSLSICDELFSILGLLIMVYPQLDSSASLSNIWGVKEGIAGLIIRLGHGVGFKSECRAARQHSNLLGHLWTSSPSDMAKGFSGGAHLLCL